MAQRRRQKRRVSPSARQARKLARVADVEDVSGADLKEAVRRIRGYARPYQEALVRSEQSQHLLEMVEGLTSDLERKSVEPIAVMHGIHRRPLQRFVGDNGWSWAPLREQLWSEVSAEIGLPDGALVIDGSATPKKGTGTVGAGRQWCGRLGKTDNCVVGVYAAYVGKNELTALVGAELYLPEAWASDRARRIEAYVPPEVVYRSQPEIGAAIVKELAPRVPFEWVLGDDEFGRARHFRDAVAAEGKSYVVDVPENTSVRRVNKWGRVGDKNWNVKKLVRSRPVSDWRRFHIRDGEKGPIEKRALMLPVATRRENVPPEKRWVHEVLVVIEELDATQRWYCLAKAKHGTTLTEFVRRASQRHCVEETFEEAKGEVGLDHFEVRAWHGWYHHMTLVQLSHWFLVRERRRLAKKNA
jgi:SRSO17 transposase